MGLAECCHLERVSLLAYSPLAMGLLTVSVRMQRHVVLALASINSRAPLRTTPAAVGSPTNAALAAAQRADVTSLLVCLCRASTWSPVAGHLQRA